MYTEGLHSQSGVSICSSVVSVQCHDCSLHAAHIEANLLSKAVKSLSLLLNV